MFVSHFKGAPSAFVRQYRGGEVVRQGRGLSFFYAPMTTTVVSVPVTTQDLPFAFSETTSDFQDVAVQGQLTYRISDPERAAELLDFSVQPATQRYRSEDPQKLEDRILSAVRAQARAWVRQRPLEAALKDADALAASLLARVRQDATLAEMGIAVEALYLGSITAAPETKRALEAEYREALLRRADEAVYGRRAAAVAEERRIRQSELDTEVELETARQRLVEQQAQNQITLAEADARADEMKLAPYAELPARTLVGLALRDWAEHGGSVDALTVTPDLVTNLVQALGRENR
ncbi:SPFH domain-containing protein [Rubricoccus marinus]|uniref:Band 7 domain-containing protein n=1 Tax=Rubricoccus marinus TaxID=716817 RepID=A0A259TVL7_9BACT|nr:SPFH domain-containing protein [Rubricoccus marinus]OZC01812.1 hypothetical protein BSZ36_01700 [Rubricoccus marinus]